MNRRSFFKSFAAGAALLVAPKLLLPDAPPLKPQTEARVELPPPIDTRRLDVRAAAKEDLAKWLAHRFDETLFKALTA